MYQPTLALLFFLLALQLTNMCSAQEPTSTTDPLGYAPDDSDRNCGIITRTITEYTTSTVLETSTVTLVPNQEPHSPTNASPPSGEVNPPNPIGNVPQPSVSEAGRTPPGLNSASESPADGLKTIVVTMEGSTTLTTVINVPQGISSTRSNSTTSTASDTRITTESAVTSTCDPNLSTARKGLSPAIVGAIVGSLLGAVVAGILFVFWFKRRKGGLGFKKLEEGASNDPPVPRNGVTPFILPPPEPHNATHLNSKQRAMQEALRPISSGTSPITSIGESWTLAESILSHC